MQTLWAVFRKCSQPFGGVNKNLLFSETTVTNRSLLSSLSALRPALSLLFWACNCFPCLILMKIRWFASGHKENSNPLCIVTKLSSAVGLLDILRAIWRLSTEIVLARLIGAEICRKRPIGRWGTSEIEKAAQQRWHHLTNSLFITINIFVHFASYITNPAAALIHNILQLAVVGICPLTTEDPRSTSQGLQKVNTCGLWGASLLPPAEASSAREKLLLLRKLLEQWTSRKNTSWTSRRNTCRTSSRNTSWTSHRNISRTSDCRNRCGKSCRYIPPPDSVDKFPAKESWYRAQYRGQISTFKIFQVSDSTLSWWMQEPNWKLILDHDCLIYNPTNRPRTTILSCSSFCS